MSDHSLHLRFVYDAASPESLRNAIQRNGIEIRNETELFRLHDPPITLSFRIKTPQSGGLDLERPMLSATVNPDVLAPSEGESTLGSLLKLVGEVYNQTEPRYGFGMETWHLEAVNAGHRYAVPSPITEETLAANQLNWPTEIMLFPPAMVHTYGERWLRDLPVARIEELDDGTLVIAVTDRFGDPEVETAVNELAESFKDHPDHPIGE